MANLTNQESIQKARRFAVPLTVFLVITLLSATFGKSLVENIFLNRDRISQLKGENLTLQGKKDQLAALDRNLLTQQAQVVLLAVPSEPSALAAMSSIRAQAFEKKVSITEIKASEKAGVQKGVREASLSFEFEGNLGFIMELINTLKTTAPVVKVSKIKMLGSGTDRVVSADVDLQTFWVELPESLPPATTPFTALSKKDKDLIAEMEKLRTAVGRSSVPAVPAGKTNPFTE